MTEGVLARKDHDPHKRFPNGLKATLKAIRKFWDRKRKTDFRPGVGRRPGAFAELFQATYNRVGGYYHEDERSIGAVRAAVDRLEGSGEELKSDISFWQIRSFAEFTELPSSLLVLYGQMVSYEAQGRTRVEIRDFLSRCRQALDALDEYTKGKDDREHIFHHRFSVTENEMEYIALLAGLYDMSVAFGGWGNRLRDPGLHRT